MVLTPFLRPPPLPFFTAEPQSTYGLRSVTGPIFSAYPHTHHPSVHTPTLEPPLSPTPPQALLAVNASQ